MRIVMIAALLAAHLSAVESPAQAAELPHSGSAMHQGDGDDLARSDPSESLEIIPGDRAAAALGAAAAPMAAAAAAAAQEEEEPRKKRKSTGDKVLTGAAVILGVGALAVGGLLVAIFVN